MSRTSTRPSARRSSPAPRRATRRPATIDIFTRIRQALPIATQILADGIDCNRVEFTEPIPAEEPRGLSDEQTDQFVDWTNATYAVGIAVGLLLNAPVVLGQGLTSEGGAATRGRR